MMSFGLESFTCLESSWKVYEGLHVVVMATRDAREKKEETRN